MTLKIPIGRDSMKIPVPLLLLLLVPVITAGCGSSASKDAISEQQPPPAGATLACLACHSSNQPSLDPTLTNSTGLSGKHFTHVTTRNIACVRCHLNYTGQATHMNVTLDTSDPAVRIVYFDSANPNGQWINDTGLQKGSCSSLVCHGTDTPDWYGTGWTMPNCATCHIGSLDPLATNGSGTAGKHVTHVTDSGFTCLKCHSTYISEPSHMNGTMDTPSSAGLVFFDSLNPIGQWINDTGSQTGSCSNVYCHSIAQTTTGGPLTLNSSGYKTPTWYGSLDADCTNCHGNPSASGSHLKHAGGGTGQYTYTCEQCHSDYVPPGVSTHADGAINTAIKATQGGTYNGDTMPGNGFSNCSNTYCHSDGTSYVTGVVPANTSPTWGSAAVPLACNTCHGTAGSAGAVSWIATFNGEPSYPQMTANELPAVKANAHYYHRFNHQITCQYCHYSTTTDGNTIAGPAKHANGEYDVVPGGSYYLTPVTFTYVPDPGGLGGYCQSISCHGGESRFWGKYQTYIPSIATTDGPGCYQANFSVASISNVTYPLQYEWNFGDGQTASGTAYTLPIISGTYAYTSGTSRTVTISGRDSALRYFKKSQTVTPQAVANQAPTADWLLTTIDRYDVTVTDRSYDPDYNICGTGPGMIAINWKDPNAPNPITGGAIYLTNSPSNANYTYHYYAVTSDTTYSPTLSITDNSNKPSWNTAPALSVTVPGLTSISGRITLLSGAGVGGLSVKLKHADRTLITTATTGSDGSFSFPTDKYYDQYLLVDPDPTTNGYTFSRTITCSPWLWLPNYMSCVYTNTTEANFTAYPL